MAHENQSLISKIKLPGSETVYYIHDEDALHSEDLVKAVFFKGAALEATILAKTTESVGAVWHATDTGNEWLYVGTNTTEYEDNPDSDNNGWQKLGSPLVENHVHTLTPQLKNVTSGGVVSGYNVTANQQSISVAGTAVAQEWSGSVTINPPTVTPTTSGCVAGIETTTLTAHKVTSNTSVTTTGFDSSKTDYLGTQAAWGGTVDNGLLTITWDTNDLPITKNTTATETVVEAVTPLATASSTGTVDAVTGIAFGDITGSVSGTNKSSNVSATGTTTPSITTTAIRVAGDTTATGGPATPQ